MDGPRDYILSEKIQIPNDKYHMIVLICGIQKNYINELIYRTVNRLTDLENEFMVRRGGRMEGRERLGFGD